MKRFVSIIMTFAIVMTMFTAVSAAPADLNSATSFVANPYNLNLGLSIKSRLSEHSTGAYTDSLSALLDAANGDVLKVDYQATLDMSSIRQFFNEEFIGTVLNEPGNTALKSEFDNGVITSTFTATINYPATMNVASGKNLNTAGVLNAGAIFSETGRTVSGNTTTITFKSRDGLKVSDLNVNDDLKDVIFTLDDVAEYTANGTYTVSVNFTGSTSIAFASKTQVVNYTATASNSVIANEPMPVGGGSTTEKQFTVKFNTNGGTAVDSVKVKNGQTVSEPSTTKADYEFKGWYTDSNLSKLFDFSSPIKNNMILFAKWEKVEKDPEKDPVDDGWFIDVPKTEWYYDAVKFVDDAGLMEGVADKVFDPEENITRAMFVTILYRLENEPNSGKVTFNDVELNSWYDKAVAWATETGVTNGVDKDQFSPNSIISREQIAAMLYRYMKLKGYDVSAADNTNILSYTDAENITEYAIPAIQWAVGDGILKGKSESTLNPLDNATRAEVAMLLMRLLQQIQN